MGGSLTLIQVTGRKSARVIQLPVNFHRNGNDLWVISSRERVWWRNLQTNSRVVLWIDGRQLAAGAELVLDESEVAERLALLCIEKNWMARPLKIGFDEDKLPKREDLQRVAHERLFVRLIPE